MKRRKSSKKIIQPKWNSLQNDLSKYKLSESEMVRDNSRPGRSKGESPKIYD
jgi:hypothetical protein